MVREKFALPPNMLTFDEKFIQQLKRGYHFIAYPLQPHLFSQIFAPALFTAVLFARYVCLPSSIFDCRRNAEQK